MITKELRDIAANHPDLNIVTYQQSRAIADQVLRASEYLMKMRNIEFLKFEWMNECSFRECTHTHYLTTIFYLFIISVVK